MSISGNPYLFLVGYHGGEAMGRVEVYGREVARRATGQHPLVVVVRAGSAPGVYAAWGHLFGPLDPMPGQFGSLVEVACTGADPLVVESWTTTGRRWPLGTSPEVICRDAAAARDAER